MILNSNNASNEESFYDEVSIITDKLCYNIQKQNKMSLRSNVLLKIKPTDKIKKIMSFTEIKPIPLLRTANLTKKRRNRMERSDVATQKLQFMSVAKTKSVSGVQHR